MDARNKRNMYYVSEEDEEDNDSDEDESDESSGEDNGNGSKKNGQIVHHRMK